MSNLWAIYLFDWINITISFFNTIQLFWLGLMVLLNAERRTGGTWVAGGGMLAGGIFFAGHTAVMGRVIGTFSEEMEFWWWVGWLPFIGLPYMWYVVIAWYTGVVNRGVHRSWLIIMSLLGLAAIGLLVFANPLPSYGDVVQRTPTSVLTVGGSAPGVALIYPVYSTLCIVLSILALRHPVASDRFMGDVARKRARPWLVATSFVLLVVSLSVGAAATWFLYAIQTNQLPNLSLQSLSLLITFDLFISGLIAVVIVLLGRAVVSYEVFTGKVLPRGGLRRQWRNSLILAAGYGGLMAASLGFLIDPIYRLLLATILMTVFYALVSWRTYLGRERLMDRLRPFVASQHIYEQLLRTSAPLDVDVAIPLRALCEDVLGARAIALVPQGPLTPLVGAGLSYPPDALTIPGELPALADTFASPQTLCVPLTPTRDSDACWAVPLWSERGLIGVLLLSEKRDSGLYTQEEIAIARATGERLIDTQASAELARRLMGLQRQRLTESQVLDRRTRRVLHDDVLPQLHTAMLLLGSVQSPASNDGQTSGTPAAVTTYDEAVGLLSDVHHQIANLLHALPPTAAPEVTRLGLVGTLRQTIQHELGSNFDRVAWQIDPQAEQAARDLPSLAAEVVFYAAREAIRNAARYGRGNDSTRPLHLTISLGGANGLELAITDDGVGMAATRAAATTSGGSGQGLALHSTMMAVIGGTMTVESTPGTFTRVVLALPAPVAAPV